MSKSFARGGVHRNSMLKQTRKSNRELLAKHHAVAYDADENK